MLFSYWDIDSSVLPYLKCSYDVYMLSIYHIYYKTVADARTDSRNHVKKVVMPLSSGSLQIAELPASVDHAVLNGWSEATSHQWFNATLALVCVSSVLSQTNSVLSTDNYFHIVQ